MEILKMLVTSKVSKITVMIPAIMAAEPFEAYANVKIERIPDGLFGFKKKSGYQNIHAHNLLRLYEAIRNRSIVFCFLEELIREAPYFISFLINKPNIRKLTDFLKNNKLSFEGYDFLFFVQKKNIAAYLEMILVARQHGFKEAIGLSKEGLC